MTFNLLAIIEIKKDLKITVVLRKVIFCSAVFVLAGCVTTTPTPVRTVVTSKTIPFDPMVFDVAEKAIQERRYEDATNVLRRIFENDSDSTHGKILVAEIILAKGNALDAARRFDEISESPNFGARALQGKALAFFKLKRLVEGKELLDRAIKKDPTLWRSLNALGYYYDSVQDWKNATAVYDRAIELNPQNEVLFNNRGFSRLLQKQFSEAVKDLKVAVRLKPNLRIPRLNLQLALAWKGDYARAKFSTEQEKHGESLNNIGYIALLRGDLRIAEAHFLRAIEADASFNKTAHSNLNYVNKLKEVRKDENARTSAKYNEPVIFSKNSNGLKK